MTPAHHYQTFRPLFTVCTVRLVARASAHPDLNVAEIDQIVRRRMNNPVGTNARGKLPYTEELGKALCEAVEEGLDMRVACQLMGLPLKTLWSWFREGLDNERSKYRQFAIDLTRARAIAEQAALAAVRQGMKGGVTTKVITRTSPDGTVEREESKTPPDWRAAAWFLERAFPERYGRRPHEVTVSGPGGGPIAVAAVTMGETAARIAAQIEQAREDAERTIEGETSE